jgi:hypothetical protein
VVRLAHRRRGGLALRPDASCARYPAATDNRPNNTATDNQPTDASPDDQPPCDDPCIKPQPVMRDGSRRLLEPIVSVGEPLLRLRPEGWLLPLAPASGNCSQTGNRSQTDGLCVINADVPQETAGNKTPPVVTALESRTQPLAEIRASAAGDRAHYRQVLRDAGAQGVALQFAVADCRHAEFAFVDSPFYDHAGLIDEREALTSLVPAVEIAPSVSFAGLVAPQVAPAPAVAPAVAVDVSPAPDTVSMFDAADVASFAAAQFMVDPRVIPPGELHLGLAEPAAADDPSPGRYFVGDLRADPYADACCLAHRQYHLQRESRSGAAETFEGHTPILHVCDVPLFLQPSRLSHPSGNAWHCRAAQLSGLFFPKQIDWELAADKPGAMFHTLIQARTTDAQGRTRREPLIDFALREPQYIRVAGCVTAAIFFQDGPNDTAVCIDRDRAIVTLVWTEVLGRIRVDELEGGTWLVGDRSGMVLTKPPLELFVEFNGDVLAVGQGDAAVPAYRIERQIEEPPLEETSMPQPLPAGETSTAQPLEPEFRPAAMYAVSGPTWSDFIKPQPIDDPSVPGHGANGSVTASTEGYRFTLDDPSVAIAAGTRFVLENFDPSAPDGSSHRLLRVEDHYLLMQEVLTNVSGLEFSLDGFPDVIHANVQSHRPLVLHITDPAPPDDLTGRSITLVDPNEVRLTRVVDATPADAPRLCKVDLMPNAYLVLAPTAVPAAGGSPLIQGNRRLRHRVTSASGYLELDQRARVTCTAEGTNRWKPAISLTVDPDSADIHVPSYVRLTESPHPETSGMFRVLAFPDDPKHWLARPSAGNGQDGTGGTATEIADQTPPPRHIASVCGNSPIEITLAPGGAEPWPMGTPIVIQGVQGVPEANGTWIVEPVANDRYHLFEPSVAWPTEPGAAPTDAAPNDTVSAVAAQVVPLSTALAPVASDQNPGSTVVPDRVAKLEHVPRWTEQSRPLLQVYWAGAADFARPLSEELAWRRGEVAAQLYGQAKQIRFLAHAQLTAKLTFVLSVLPRVNVAASPQPVLQRTILFGDAAPAFAASARLEAVAAGGLDFVLEVPDNREGVSVRLPPTAGDQSFLYVVKTLPSGVAVIDRWPRPTGGPLTS